MQYIFLLFTFFVIPKSVFAVLPPDIIFSVGTQLWQIVIGVGALIVGSITALFPFLRNISFGSLSVRRIALSLGVSCALLGLAYLFYLSGAEPARTHIPTTLSATTTGHEFHSHRFVFFGTRKNGEQILINMDINRKELPEGGFIHYYVGDIIYGTSSIAFDMQIATSSREVLPDLFFSQFQRTTPPDHSARESYALAFSSGGHQYAIETELITSDFLVKNEPEYTAYIGVGDARGIVDGEQILFHAMIERIYSTDYRPTIFFDPENKIESETVQLVLWDEDGNFYIADRSQVKDFSTAYASHFWGMEKLRDGTMRRFFDSDATMTTQNSRVGFVVQFDGVGVAHRIEVKLLRPFEGKLKAGYVEGLVSGNGEARPIYGYGYQHRYGEQ
jgi:hypothetical protein